MSQTITTETGPIVLPASIVVERDPKGLLQLVIDGKRFPWAIARESLFISVAPPREGVDTITVNLMADRITIVDVDSLTPDIRDDEYPDTFGGVS